MKIVKTLLGSCLAATLALPPSGALAQPQDTAAVDEALDLYWARKREIKTLQKREFLKESRHEFTLFSGVIPNDEFFSYYPIGGRWDYYFAEDFAVEAWGSYLVTVNSDLKDFLEQNTLYNILVEIPQTLNWLAGVDVLWSPIHGKIGLFTDKLSHFDFHVAFGAGAIATTIVDEETRLEESKIDVSGNIGLGVRFYLSEALSLRLDYRQYAYPAETGGVAMPVEITLGVSFFTAAPQ